ncbi:MAG: hypothetical protein L0G22_10045, partial [Propionibacteriaceae bacterium]|nr:hypothetical protein [Propionibacteriaceae bacterium]
PTRGEEMATEHTRGEDTPAEEVDIFRAEARHPGSSPLPSATPAPVAASQTAREVVQPAPAAAVAAPGGGMSLTLRGFLIGLVAALLGGGLALAVRLLGA